MKRHVIRIASVAAFSLSIILALFFVAKDLSHRHNSFIRLFPPHPASLENSIDIQFNTFYISGISNQHIYLANQLVPFRLLVFSLPLRSDKVEELKLARRDDLKWVAPRVFVDSPDYVVMDGTLPAVYRGKLNQYGLRHLPHDSAFFVESVPIGPNSFAIRSANKANTYMLGKESESKPYLRFNSGLLKKQIDGLFCTDGMLHYDKRTSRLLYLYYYRNQFLVMDTSLNLLYKGKTIDTTSVAKLDVAWIHSGETAVLSSPPLIVNKASSVSGNFLFVWSNLLSKNESEDLFKKEPVIDVYRLDNQEYQFSFYLPGDFGKKLKGFRVFNNSLFALYDHYLLEYSLAGDYFKGKLN